MRSFFKFLLIIGFALCIDYLFLFINANAFILKEPTITDSKSPINITVPFNNYYTGAGIGISFTKNSLLEILLGKNFTKNISVELNAEALVKPIKEHQSELVINSITISPTFIIPFPNGINFILKSGLGYVFSQHHKIFIKNLTGRIDIGIGVKVYKNIFIETFYERAYNVYHNSLYKEGLVADISYGFG